MHIEFKLPRGAGGLAAGHYNNSLKKRVQAWAEEHNVTVINWTNGYRCCFEFANNRDYTVFALSWNSRTEWDQYTIVYDD